MSKRTVLIPPYLENNPIWQDLITALDGYWATNIDQPISTLKSLRQLYLTNSGTLTKINAGQILDSVNDFDTLEPTVLAEQLNLLGFALTNTDIVQSSDLLRLYRNLAKFWYSKGTPAFIDFIGFCLNAQFTLNNLWTQDYVSFYSRGDFAIQAPLWGSNYNAFLYSEQFDNAAWTPTGVVVQANQDTAPNQTNTMDRVRETSSNGYHSISQNASVTNGTTYTFPIYIKGSLGRQWVALQLSGAGFTGSPYAFFDLTNGVLGVTSASSTGFLDARIIQEAPYLYRIYITATASATGTGTGTLLLSSGDSISDLIYTGNGIASVSLWGGMFYPGTYTSWYVPTTSAPVNTTGTWYSTSQVEIAVDIVKYANVDLGTLKDFFYEFSNYNLVLRDIDTFADILILDSTGDDNLLGMGVLINTTFNIKGGSYCDYIPFDGSTGNYAFTPDNSLLDMSVGFDVVAQVQLQDWTVDTVALESVTLYDTSIASAPVSTPDTPIEIQIPGLQCIASKWDSSAYCWAFGVMSSGYLALKWYQADGSLEEAFSTVPLDIPPYGVLWVRAIITGSSGISFTLNNQTISGMPISGVETSFFVPDLTGYSYISYFNNKTISGSPISTLEGRILYFNYEIPLPFTMFNNIAVADAPVSTTETTVMIGQSEAGGVSPYSVLFYTSYDGKTWTQLGLSTTGSEPLDMTTGGSALELGASDLGASSNFRGKIYNFSLINDLSGEIVAGVNPHKLVPASTTGTGTNLETWSFQGTSLPNFNNDYANYVTLLNNGVGSRAPNGNYIWTPSLSGNCLSTSADIQVNVAPTYWSTASSQALVSKWNESTQSRSYMLTLEPGGYIKWWWTTDGTSATINSYAATLGASNNEFLWVRVTHQINGSGDTLITFYTSSDGITWTQLGSTGTIAGTTPIFNSRESVLLGAYDRGAAGLLTGTIKNFSLYAGTGGTLVAGINTNKITYPADPSSKDWFTGVAGETWHVVNPDYPKQVLVFG